MRISIEERLARHLRANRKVDIRLYGTVVPPGWVPHPSMASKLREPVTAGEWHVAYIRWRRELRVGCIAQSGRA